VGLAAGQGLVGVAHGGEWIRCGDGDVQVTGCGEGGQLWSLPSTASTLADTALWDEIMDARRAQFAGILADRLAAALDDARARGEITHAVPSRNAAAMAIGPMYYGSTIEHAPTDSALIEAVVAALGTWSTERWASRNGLGTLTSACADAYAASTPVGRRRQSSVGGPP